jgi:hypothetical protein
MLKILRVETPATKAHDGSENTACHDEQLYGLVEGI